MLLSIESCIALIAFCGSLLFGVMKFYHVFRKLEESMRDVKEAIERLNNHETRIARIEEQTKTLFKRTEGVKRI